MTINPYTGTVGVHPALPDNWTAPDLVMIHPGPAVVSAPTEEAARQFFAEHLDAGRLIQVDVEPRIPTGVEALALTAVSASRAYLQQGATSRRLRESERAVQRVKAATYVEALTMVLPDVTHVDVVGAISAVVAENLDPEVSNLDLTHDVLVRLGVAPNE